MITIDELLERKPSRREVAEIICKSANHECVHLLEYWAYHELAPKFNLKITDFYDEAELLPDNEKCCAGYHWRVKEGVA